jgi:hypothetical protein
VRQVSFDCRHRVQLFLEACCSAMTDSGSGLMTRGDRAGAALAWSKLVTRRDS